MKKYELVNLEGCLMETYEAESIEEATDYFEENYTGEYKIIPKDEIEYLQNDGGIEVEFK